MPLSVVDENIEISQENWAVSILRKPKGKNPEHAFLLLEGEDEKGMVILRRYDLVEDETNKKKSKIVITPAEDKPVPSLLAKDAFKLSILKNEEVYAKAWGITKAQADALHQSILLDKITPPNYFQSGDQSLFAKSVGINAHSCFTWSRSKLLSLQDERIQLPEKWTDIIAAVTSLHITGDNEPVSGKNCLVM